MVFKIVLNDELEVPITEEVSSMRFSMGDYGNVKAKVDGTIPLFHEDMPLLRTGM